MKNHALFSSEDKSKTIKCRLLQFLFCALRVNENGFMHGAYRYVIDFIFISSYKSLDQKLIS